MMYDYFLPMIYTDKATLSLSQTSPGFYVSALNSFENTVGKGEIALNEQFLLFPQCFIPMWRTLCHFHKIENCHLQTLLIWKSLKFVVWERVNTCATKITTSCQVPFSKISGEPRGKKVTNNLSQYGTIIVYYVRYA